MMRQVNEHDVSFCVKSGSPVHRSYSIIFHHILNSKGFESIPTIKAKFIIPKLTMNGIYYPSKIHLVGIREILWKNPAPADRWPKSHCNSIV